MATIEVGSTVVGSVEPRLAQGAPGQLELGARTR